jgi:DNA-binding transcriptional regulator YiaG
MMPTEQCHAQLEFDREGCLISPSLTADDVVKFREKLKLTQEQFAQRFDIPISTLRKWEQNRAKPVISQARLVFYNKLFDEKAEVVSRTDARKLRRAA